MKYRPILFSTPMVQAILEGRKTMTRRIVKSNANQIEWMPIVLNGYGGFCDEHGNPVKCKYDAGDILWVRETTTEESITDEEPFQTIYRADVGSNYPMGSNKWKPSIFMPKAACRIFLEVTDVKVERLQDISEEDARNEGVLKYYDQEYFYVDYNTVNGNPCDWKANAYASFASLWESINGKESWQANQFVWVVSFKQIKKPENFN